MAETPSAAVVWTGPSGQRQGSDSGAAAVLDSKFMQVKPLENPYARLTQQYLAQQARQKLADDKARQKSAEQLIKMQGELKFNDLMDQYETEGTKELNLMANELGRMKAEGIPMEEIASKQRQYKRKIEGMDGKMKQVQGQYQKWVDEGAKLVDEGGSKYNQDRYFEKVQQLNDLIGEGDLDKTLEFVRDPKNTPLIANVDPTTVIKGLGIGDDTKTADLEELVDITLDPNRNEAKELVESLVAQGYGKDSEEVSKKLKEQARLMYPYRPPKTSSTTSGGSGGADKFNFTPKYDGNGLQEIVITRSGTNDNLPPIMVNGTTFQANAIVVDSGGNVTGVRGEEIVGATVPENWNNMSDYEKAVWEMSNKGGKRISKVIPINEINTEITNQLNNLDVSSLAKKYVKKQGSQPAQKQGSGTGKKPRPY